MIPIIGVTIRKETENSTTFLKVDENNIKAILINGGIPFLMPLTTDDNVIDKYLSLVDGIYFTGGNDIFPMTYGEEPLKELGKLIPERDDFEIKLYQKGEKLDLPMLGVCRGYQIMNVASGGSLYQDIYIQREKTIGHNPKNIPVDCEFHTINISKNTKLYNIFNTDVIKTNSFHHQAIKNVARNYKVSAVAQDGIIEAIESELLTFAIGVQWHPEDMIKSNDKFNSIYKALIEAALYYKKLKEKTKI